MKVIFSDRAYTAILAETAEKVKTETGGLFLGAVDHDLWYVIEAIDPGPKSIFQVAYFEYDKAYTQHLINKVANLYDERLTLIGLWHRHPGSFDQFSSTDDETNRKYANMRQEGAISALVNIDPLFRLTVYHVAQPCKYKVIDYEIGDAFIPDELLAYKSKEKLESIMSKSLGVQEIKTQQHMSLRTFLKVIYPYLKKYKLEETEIDESNDGKKDTDFLINTIIEDIDYMIEECGIALTISTQGPYICLGDQTDDTIKIYFKRLNKSDMIIFSIREKCFKYSNRAIQNAYERYLEQKNNTEYDIKHEQPKFFVSQVINKIKKSAKMGGDDQ